MIKKNIAFLFIVPLTIFFAHFTIRYMRYFDIGINNSVRFMEVYWLRTPIAIIAQVIFLLLGNKFIESVPQRTILNLTIMFFAVGLVFFGFAFFDNGVVKEGGFLRFLGYYFFNMESGQIPKGT